MGKKKSPRRQGRQRAFQVLYGCSFSPETDMSHVDKTFRNFLVQEEGSATAANDFAWELIQGVLENRDDLDRIITAYSKNWRLERIAKIELTILRVAVYEMLYREDVPVKVAVNEGIELSKKFGDSNSKRFVNGILDGLLRAVESGKTFSDLVGEARKEVAPEHEIQKG